MSAQPCAKVCVVGSAKSQPTGIAAAACRTKIYWYAY